jgi:glycosyltransferase involved in cell wall biosynthesis
MKIGVVANEFFEHGSGRMGGFGWAAREVAQCFSEQREFGIDVVFISGERSALPVRVVHGAQKLAPDGRRFGHARRLRRQQLDVLLTIDYRPAYAPILLVFPRTPVIVWARDPRTRVDRARIATLRIPGDPDEAPVDLGRFDCTSLGRLARLSRALARPVLLASPAPATLGAAAREAYGLPGTDVAFLPNPIPRPEEPLTPSPPSVLFLGRLEPIKRPWLFVELARRHPRTRFVMLGDTYVGDQAGWKPSELPPNLYLLGHLDGPAKARELAAAKVLVNTSLHEGLPVSFLEALAAETPILAFRDPEGVVSRFGQRVLEADGSGMEALPDLSAALGRLLADEELRLRLGRAGRDWVQSTHTWAAFTDAFLGLCETAGVAR